MVRPMQYLLATLGLGVVAALAVAPAHGFELSGYRQPDPVITHAEAPELAPFVAAALTEWGRTSAIRDGGSGSDLTLSFGDADGHASLSTMWVPAEGPMVGCTIVISADGWPTWSDALRRSVVAHEIGHCLGLAHADGGVMSAVLLPDAPQWFTLDDRQGIASLYPRPAMPHRATAPMIAGQ